MSDKSEFDIVCTAGSTSRKEELTIQVDNYKGLVEVFTTETSADGTEDVGLVNLTFTEFEALKKWVNQVDLTII